MHRNRRPMQPWCLGTACPRLSPPQLLPVQVMRRFSMYYLEPRTLMIFVCRWQMGLVGLADLIIGGRFGDHFHSTRRSTKQARISNRGTKVALQWECELRVVTVAQLLSLKHVTFALFRTDRPLPSFARLDLPHVSFSLTLISSFFVPHFRHHSFQSSMATIPISG